MVESAIFNEQGLIVAVIDGQQWIFADDPGNRHRRMVAEWEAEGNTIGPFEAAPAPVPTSLSRRQLILALANMEMVTGEEALAAARTGAVPAAVQATFDNLAAADRLAAEVTWATMSIAERNHPLVALLAAANGMSEGDVDDFFRVAATL